MNLFDLFENNDGMEEGKATDILRSQIPMAKQIAADLAAHGYVKGTPEYKHAYDVELDYYRKFGFQPNSDHELDEKSSLKLGAKLGSRLVNRRQAHALTTKFRKPKLNFEEDDEVHAVFKPGDRVTFTTPRGSENGVVLRHLSGATEVKFDSGETRGVFPHALKKAMGAGQTLDEILAPSQLAKLQSIKAQLPKAGGQTPSIPSDTDRADAEAWLNKLKNKDPVADKKSGEDPLNFDRPGRPRQASYHEIQGKIQRLKSIKDLLKSIDKTEPRAMRSANKFGGSDEISTKAQMMHDVVDNLNLNYTNEQELESIERRLSEYLQQLVAKSAAWKKPSKPSKHGAVTIIKHGEEGTLAEGTDDDIDADAGEMGTPEFRKALERLKQLANAGKPKDSAEKEETKKKVNENNSAPVTAHGYAYNRQDQRVSWTKEFASEAEAKEWARRRNATIISIVPNTTVVEEENRFTLYINGKPQTHHATAEEARRFAETVKLKYPDVKIEIKQEMREESDIEESWRSKLAGAALVGSMALGGGGIAHAQGDLNHREVVQQIQSGKIQNAEQLLSVMRNAKNIQTVWKMLQLEAKKAGMTEYATNDSNGINKVIKAIGNKKTNEGIGGNMTVRSDPLTKLKQHENIKLKQADRFKGNKNRNNLVKAEAAKNATVAKPPMATKNPVAKFAQSVAKGAGKHQANDFKSQIKGLDRKAKHKGKDKFGLGESPNFLSWAMTAGYNVIGNPRVYEDAKRIYNNLLNEDKSDLEPGQYYLWTVNFDDGSSKKIKVNDEKFDVTKYYAGKNQVVVNVDYNWEPHNG